MEKINQEEKNLIKKLKQEKKYFIRSPELKLEKKVYLTKEAYIALRNAKKEYGQSMAKIVCDLILKNFN